MSIQPADINLDNCVPKVFAMGRVRYTHKDKDYTLNELVQFCLPQFNNITQQELFATWHTAIKALEGAGRAAQEKKVCTIWARFLSVIGRFCCKGHFYYDRDAEMAQIQKKFFSNIIDDVAIFFNPRGLTSFDTVVGKLKALSFQCYTGTLPEDSAEEYSAIVSMVNPPKIAIQYKEVCLEIGVDAQSKRLKLEFMGKEIVWKTAMLQQLNALAPYARCYEALIQSIPK